MKIKSRAIEAGLSNVITACENGSITEGNLLQIFYRAISQACAINVVDAEKCLSEFNGAMFENEISKYKQVCSDFEELTKHELISRLASRIPEASTGVAANSSEIGILQKAIRSGGRMMAIRKLFDSIPNLLRKLCPCMLMSPISVAQYIDPQYTQFDMVVFDEASQLPTSEAVGAIARGENLIIVGDPKQLPPTSFFSVDKVDEDNFEKEDLESILDDCMALSMPQKHLLWHYRSRHESLIAFSNMEYYENKLYTFPSPNDMVSSVKFIPINGFYDRGKTKQNRAEAEAVIAEIIRRLRDTELRKQSIGVVTFSSVQQNLIDDLLVETFAKNPELEEISNQMYEALFIKNLENVQGDERDVILFSIGYGPDQTGKTALNFGPLNRDGGWRRLNVAVSRARREMIVFSTLKPEQIDLSKTRAQGIAGLKSFLEFAQKGKNVLPIKLSNASAADKDIAEKVIAEKIKELGYEVHTNIGCSEYKIDIGIVHPHKPSEYVLGIMCDGKKYRAANTARDRNVLQNGVLKSLGWNLHRLWIIDWWENQNKELHKIRVAVENAISNEEKVLPPEPQCIAQQQTAVYQRLEQDTTTYTEKNIVYSSCTLISVDRQSEDFFLPQLNSAIYSQIKHVLEIEAPISKSLLCKRILSAWGITRMGPRLDKRFEELFDNLKLSRTLTNNYIFYWKEGQLPEEYSLFRVPDSEGNRRNMEDISSEEVANAISHILRSQISLSKADLVREVFRLFGFTRTGSSIEESISAGIFAAEKRGFVTIDTATDRVIIND